MCFEDADGGGVGGAGAAEDGVAAGGLDGGEDGGGGGGAGGGDELGGEVGGDLVDAWGRLGGRLSAVKEGRRGKGLLGRAGIVPSSLWREVETSLMQLSQLRGTAKMVWKGGIMAGVGRAAPTLRLFVACKTCPSAHGRSGICSERCGRVQSPCL